jgi:hypothetical protein
VSSYFSNTSLLAQFFERILMRLTPLSLFSDALVFSQFLNVVHRVLLSRTPKDPFCQAFVLINEIDVLNPDNDTITVIEVNITGTKCCQTSLKKSLISSD